MSAPDKWRRHGRRKLAAAENSRPSNRGQHTLLEPLRSPCAAACGSRGGVVLLHLARLFAKGAGFLTELVGPLQHNHNRLPRFGRMLHPEVHAPMAA